MIRLAATLVILAFAHCASAQSVIGTPFVAVQGQAQVQVVPDRFPISIEVSDTGMDAAKVQSAVEALALQVLQQARALDLKDADISIGNLQIGPENEYSQPLQKNVFLGNRYSRSIGLEFHSLAGLRKFIGGVPGSKLVRLQTLPFKVSSENEVKRKLLLGALDDAKSTADLVAKGVGKHVKGVQTLSDRPLNLQAGSYMNAVDAASVESTSLLTAEQIARMPVPRDITSVGRLSPEGKLAEVALSEGVVTLNSTVYVVYLLAD